MNYYYNCILCCMNNSVMRSLNSIGCEQENEVELSSFFYKLIFEYTFYSHV